MQRFSCAKKAYEQTERGTWRGNTLMKEYIFGGNELELMLENL